MPLPWLDTVGPYRAYNIVHVVAAYECELIPGGVTYKQTYKPRIKAFEICGNSLNDGVNGSQFWRLDTLLAVRYLG